MKKKLKKIMALVLSVLLLCSTVPISESVSAATTAVSLNATSLSVYVGSSKALTVKNIPTKAKNVKKTWTSSNKAVATVSAGTVKGVKKGTSTITCKVSYTLSGKSISKSLTSKVTVSYSVSQINKSNLTTAHKSANGITTKDNGQMRTYLSSKDLIRGMGLAWNLGNTLEATSTTKLSTATAYEQAWGNPLTTQAMIDGVKSYGFNAVRIPIAWSNMVSADGKYTIDKSYFDRVETVMNYALNNGMYVIINIHWDGGWWGQFGSPDTNIRKAAWTKYQALWTQIASHYKEYSDRVIFESANEEIGSRLNDEINGVKGTLTEKQQYETANAINQKFVDIVRGTGGKNTNRHLLIAGFNTDIDKTCDTRFVMPKDKAVNGKSKLSISVHYYTPSTYCIAESDTGWGYSNTWGTASDISTLHSYFDKMKKFTSAGYGVIIGEYGVQSPNKAGIPAFMKEVITYSKKLGFCPVLWDSGSWYNRQTGKIKYNDVAKVFIDFTGSKQTLVSGGSNTGIPKFITANENTLNLKYTWTGKFVKNDGSNTKQSYAQTSCTKGLSVFNNSYDYYLYLSADWASMKQPYIKVYVAKDAESQASSLQLGYVETTDNIKDNGNDTWYDRTDFQSTDKWIEKCIQLNKADLKKYDCLYLSSGNAFTITKIEIYDAK